MGVFKVVWLPCCRAHNSTGKRSAGCTVCQRSVCTLFGIACSVVNSLRTNSVYTVLVTVKEREGSKETIPCGCFGGLLLLCQKYSRENKVAFKKKKKGFVRFFKCVISIVCGIFFLFFLHFHKCVISIVHSTSKDLYLCVV